MECVAGLMASACNDWSSSREDQRLECAICMDTYVEPCVLACSHTFCRRCLTQHYEWCTAARGPDDDNLIKCPACRQTCPLPADIRVDQIPPSAAHQFNTVTGIDVK